MRFSSNSFNIFSFLFFLCVWCSSSGTETNETRNQTTEWFKSYLVAFIAIIINPDLNIMQSILVVLDICGRYNIKTED